MFEIDKKIGLIGYVTWDSKQQCIVMNVFFCWARLSASHLTDTSLFWDEIYHVLTSPRAVYAYVCVYNSLLKIDRSTVAVKARPCDTQPLAVFLKQICFFSSFYQVFITLFMALLFLIMMSSRIPMALSDVVSLFIFIFSEFWHREGKRKW